MWISPRIHATLFLGYYTVATVKSLWRGECAARNRQRAPQEKLPHQPIGQVGLLSGCFHAYWERPTQQSRHPADKENVQKAGPNTERMSALKLPFSSYIADWTLDNQCHLTSVCAMQNVILGSWRRVGQWPVTLRDWTFSPLATNPFSLENCLRV